MYENIFKVVQYYLFGMVLFITTITTCNATTFSIINNDAAGEGFNDTTAVAPVAGNPGVTVGEQRRNVFLAATAFWAEILNSDVEIVIEATNEPQECSSFSGVLGSAGPRTAARDFPNAPLPNTFYAIALADSLANSNLYPSVSDIETRFNSNVGSAGCLESTSWSYEIPIATTGISFYETVLHEIGHGLGFLSFVNPVTGAKIAGLNDSFSSNLLDETTGVPWTDMTNSQRISSAINTGNLTWSGSKATAVHHTLSTGVTNNHIRMYAPNPVERGSSVSHWDPVVTTVQGHDEIMEAFSTAHATNGLLTNMALADTGWILLADLAITNTNGVNTVAQGATVSYDIVITNLGPGNVTVIDAIVTNDFPTPLTNISWTCQASPNASCATGSHTGNINDVVTIPLNGTVRYLVAATVAETSSADLVNTATVTMPNNGYKDLVQQNNSDSDSDQISAAIPIDSDNDEIPDEYELSIGTNPTVDDANNDIDNNGYSNLEEYRAETNPKLDTDRDGMFDLWEIENGFDLNDSSDCPSWVCTSNQRSWRSILYQ